MDSDQLKILLAHTPVSELRYFETTGSTNEDAFAWLIAGAPDFALVVANQQTAGRGRFQRRWITQADSALAFSVILRPRPEEMPFLQLYSPLGGIAVAAGLEQLQLHPQIKWPNDVLIGQKKVCGILAETAWDGINPLGVVLGIGINILPAAIPLSDSLSFPAGSLAEFLPDLPDRWEILAVILQQLKGWQSRMGNEAFMRYWQEHLAFLDQEVEIRGVPGTELSGRLVGIDPSGELILATDTGEVNIQVGDVHLRLRNN